MLDDKAMANKNASKKKSNRRSLLIGILAIIIIVIGAYAVIRQPGIQTSNPSPTPTATPISSPSSNVTGTKVLLHTTAGDITVQLRTDKPITTTNFINIVKKGWYDGSTFYRVVAGFMIQGGKINQTIPSIDDEIGTDNHNYNMTIAMAKTNQPNSATSEFFINVGNNNQIAYQGGIKFDDTYTTFGTVISGQDIVEAIANSAVTTNAYGEDSQPLNPVMIIKASIIS